MTNKEKFSKFTDIKQFRGIVKNIIHTADFNGYDENEKPIYIKHKFGSLPTLKFEFTTKIHGTNAGVSIDDEGNVFAMSRSRVLELTHDNAGFASFVEKNKDWFKHKLEMLNFHFNSKYPNFKVFLYGEWCGSGIQKNVAISQVSKKLVLFAVKLVNVDDNEDVYYLKIPKTIECPEREIYNIRKIGTTIIDIDFNKPEVAQNKLIEIVDEVEKECPVGKYFGVEGIGEGIVVSHYNKEGVRQHIFKVKGEEHAKNSGKVKVLKPVDEEFEQKKRDFVNDHGCKEWRLDQMYNETFDVINGGKGDIKKTGDYIRKVIKDVMKEEMDILILQGLTPKDVNSTISNVAKHYLFSRLDQESGL